MLVFKGETSCFWNANFHQQTPSLSKPYIRVLSLQRCLCPILSPSLRWGSQGTASMYQELVQLNDLPKIVTSVFLRLLGTCLIINIVSYTNKQHLARNDGQLNFECSQKSSYTTLWASHFFPNKNCLSHPVVPPQRSLMIPTNPVEQRSKPLADIPWNPGWWIRILILVYNNSYITG